MLFERMSGKGTFSYDLMLGGVGDMHCQVGVSHRVALWGDAKWDRVLFSRNFTGSRCRGVMFSNTSRGFFESTTCCWADCVRTYLFVRLADEARLMRLD